MGGNSFNCELIVMPLLIVIVILVSVDKAEYYIMISHLLLPPLSPFMLVYSFIS